MPVVVIPVLILLLGGALAWALAVALFAHGLTHPPRMTDGKAVYVLKRLSPADLGMEFADLKFQIGQSVALAAWWIPREKSEKTVVMLHGFADAKIGVIAWAPPWREMGYNILAVDLRAHGESGGKLCTAGHLEQSDILSLFEQLRAQYPQQTRQVALFGVSLGAAVAALVAARSQDVSAVVLDSPFATYRAAVMTHAALLRQPARLIAPAAIWLVEKVTAADFAAIAPARVVPQIKCPVLIVGGSNDPFFNAGAFETSNVHVFPDAGHLLAFSADPAGYLEVLKEFLSAIPAAC